MQFLFLLVALLFGSFTNVLIYRIPRGKSVWSPGSYCPNCSIKLRLEDKIPVLSYVWLRAKCFNCAWKIPLKYPLIELLVALIAYPFTYKVHDLFIFVFYLMLISISVALAYVDLERRLLPHALTYSGILIALAFYSFAVNPFYAMSVNPDFISNPIAERFFAGLVQVGVMFFSLDVFVDICNLLFFKEKAQRSLSPALTFNLEILSNNVAKVYSLILVYLGYLLIGNRTETLIIVFGFLGLWYLLFEILFGYFASTFSGFANSQEQTQAIPEEKKTILGGGDIAMTAFIAAVLGIKYAFLVLLAAFNLAFVFYVLWKLFLYLKSLVKGKENDLQKSSEDFSKKIPLGAALAVCFLAAMMVLS
jgi:prepilin signal peptidase PulO-like enzyme (type II secretory pathway)